MNCGCGTKIVFRCYSIVIPLLGLLKYVARRKNSVDPPRNEFRIQPADLVLYFLMRTAGFEAKNAIFAVLAPVRSCRRRRLGDCGFPERRWRGAKEKHGEIMPPEASCHVHETRILRIGSLIVKPRARHICSMAAFSRSTSPTGSPVRPGAYGPTHAAHMATWAQTRRAAKSMRGSISI